MWSPANGSSTPTLWERQVVSRIRVGDRSAFAELIDQFGATVYGVTLRMSGDQAAAESITFKVFREVWRRPGDVASALEDAGLRSCLAGRAHNYAREWRQTHPDHHRRHGSPAWTMSLDGPNLPDPAESKHAEATRRHTRTCLDALTPQECQIIEAVAVEGDSLIQVAARLGVPMGVAAAHLTTALRTLTVLYHESGSRRPDNEHVLRPSPQGRPS